MGEPEETDHAALPVPVEVEPADAESAEVESAEVESAEVESAEVESAEVESAEAEVAAATPATGGPLGNLVAAHLQRVEIAMLGRILTSTLVGALPASMVRVERRRTLLERLRRRPGHAIGVSVTLADQMLSFRAPDVGVTQASASHVVGGVVLSSRPVPVPEWLTMLAEMLNRATSDDEAIRLALEQALRG